MKTILLILLLSCSSYQSKLDIVENQIQSSSELKKDLKEDKTISNEKKIRVISSLENLENTSISLNRKNIEMQREIEELKKENKNKTEKLENTQRDAGKFEGIRFVTIAFFISIILYIIFFFLKKRNLI